MTDLRSQIAAARGHLETAVENTLFDLGRVGHAAARDILTEINDELDALEELLPGDPDE